MAAAKEKVKTLKVFYGADSKEFPFDKDGLVGDLLTATVQAFSIVTNAHLMSLYDEGRELPDASTLKDSKVKAKSELVLRQSAVKGG